MTMHKVALGPMQASMHSQARGVPLKILAKAQAAAILGCTDTRCHLLGWPHVAARELTRL